MRHIESDYLLDLQQIESEIRNLLHKDRKNLSKILDLLEDEKCLELEALRDAEEIRQSDEQAYESRNKF